MGWIIEKKKDQDLAWSTTWGWCSETFDTFTDCEKEKFKLPVDGKWQSVPWEAA